MDVLDQINKAESMYESSKSEDRLEEALEIKKIVEKLHKKLATNIDIVRWSTAPPKTHLTMQIMGQRIMQTQNPLLISKWNSKYDKIRLSVVAQTDLEKALEIQRKAIKWMAKKLKDEQLLEELDREKQKRRENREAKKEAKKRRRAGSVPDATKESLKNETRERSASNLSNSSRSTLTSVSTVSTSNLN